MLLLLALKKKFPISKCKILVKKFILGLCVKLHPTHKICQMMTECLRQKKRVQARFFFLRRQKCQSAVHPRE